MTHQEKLENTYKCRTFYGKTRIMVLEDNTNNSGPDAMASQQELTALTKAIMNDDLDLLDSLLNEISGKNISDRLVTVSLPKRWHQVAKNVMSTPLRTSITWRNVKALDAIIGSKCVISDNDLCLGLQKILRHTVGGTEVAIVRRLVKQGATVESPVHFTLFFEKSFLADNGTACTDVVNAMCRAQPSNNLLGQLLLSTSKRSAKNHSTAESGYDILTARWPHFSATSARTIMASDFSPYEFIRDVKVWLAFGRVAFQHLIHALPLLVQTMSGCPLEALGWVLRHVGRYYPHVSSEGRDKVRQAARLMYEAGLDIPGLMHVACLSPRFMANTGLTKWTKQHRIRMRSLQHHSRRVIRDSITRGNVYVAMETATNLPTPLKDYILLKNAQELPWGDDRD